MDGDVRAGDQLGKYRLERLLGRGGMGEVWLAHDPDLDRRVALKLLHRRLATSEDAQARFQREGRAMARLRHPNVIVVHDATFSDGRGVIAMELIDGESLATWMSRSHPAGEIVRVILAAGRGLAAAHAAGMVHRDFKPHNVLIDREGRIVVTDFGLARATGTLETRDVKGASATPALADGSVALAATAAPVEGVATPALADGSVALAATAAPVEGAASPAPADGSVALAETATPAPSDALAATATPVRGETVASTSPRSTPPPRADSKGDLATPLTATGSVLGTPAYMAPEQLAGEPADERSDVFAYCVTAWELFAGERPYSGDSFEGLARAIAKGRRNPSDRIPRSLRAVFARGLDPDPEGRWPTMTALLSAIDRAWKRPRRIAVGVGALVLLGGVAVTFAATREAQVIEGCGDPEVTVAPAWSPEIRADFAKLLDGKAYQARVLRLFDRWGKTWKEAQVRNCRAPDAQDFAPRRACLESVRDEIALVMSQRASFPPEMWAASDLPRIVPLPDTCEGDPRGIEPAGPEPELRGEVAQIRIGLAMARGPLLAGSVAALSVDVTPLLQRARATGYAPVISEAMLMNGITQFVRAKPAELRAVCAALNAASTQAEAARFERMMVEAQLIELECLVMLPERADAARQLLARLDTATQRSRNPVQRAQVLGYLAHDDLVSGRRGLSLKRYGEAAALFRDLEMTEWEARSILSEAEVLFERNRGDDLERAAAKVRSTLPMVQANWTDNVIDLLRKVEWHRGRVTEAPAWPVESPKDPIALVVRVVDERGPVAGAVVGASTRLQADADRVMMPELGGGVQGTTTTDGTVTMTVSAGAMLLVRAASFTGVGVAPKEAGTVTIRVGAAASLTGETRGMRDGPTDDPVDLAARAAIWSSARVMVYVPSDSGRPSFRAPIDAHGTWRLPNVPPGTYVVAVQAKSGLDMQERQIEIDLRPGDNVVPPFSFETRPRVIEVVVRTTAKSVLSYAAAGPLPTTVLALSKQLRAAPAVSASEVGLPQLSDEGVSAGDLIARISVPAGPAVVCAHAGDLATESLPISTLVFTEPMPMCQLVDPAATRVVIGK